VIDYVKSGRICRQRLIVHWRAIFGGRLVVWRGKSMIKPPLSDQPAGALHYCANHADGALFGEI
jgi:hypothetical protein